MMSTASFSPAKPFFDLNAQGDPGLNSNQTWRSCTDSPTLTLSLS